MVEEEEEEEEYDNKGTDWPSLLTETDKNHCRHPGEQRTAKSFHIRKYWTKTFSPFGRTKDGRSSTEQRFYGTD